MCSTIQHRLGHQHQGGRYFQGPLLQYCCMAPAQRRARSLGGTWMLQVRRVYHHPQQRPAWGQHLHLDLSALLTVWRWTQMRAVIMLLPLALWPHAPTFCMLLQRDPYLSLQSQYQCLPLSLFVPTHQFLSLPWTRVRASDLSVHRHFLPLWERRRCAPCTLFLARFSLGVNRTLRIVR
jgi:hypothetical protein